MSMKYLIEDNVPMRPRSHGGQRKYPFDLMKIKQSFFVPINKSAPKHLTKSLHASARYVGIKVETRLVDGGVRVWRTA